VNLTTKALGLIAALLVFPTSLAHAASPKAPPAKSAKEQRLEISVTKEGFVPASAKVKVGQPVTLVVTRKVERTCATEIVVGDYAINKPLPLDTAVEVTFTPTKPGKIRFSCGMDMIAGELVAE
jgi:plastocyanin domain-containing protein